MTEEFEPAACPEFAGVGSDNLVTDEEFRSWVQRSQAHTDEVMREWDEGSDVSARNDGPESWDPSVEFFQEIDGEIEDVPVQNTAMRRAIRRRNRRLGRAARADHTLEEAVSPDVPYVSRSFTEEIVRDYYGTVSYRIDNVDLPTPDPPREQQPPCEHAQTSLQILFTRHGAVNVTGSAARVCYDCGTVVNEFQFQHITVTNVPPTHDFIRPFRFDPQ